MKAPTSPNELHSVFSRPSFSFAHKRRATIRDVDEYNSFSHGGLLAQTLRYELPFAIQ